MGCLFGDRYEPAVHRSLLFQSVHWQLGRLLCDQYEGHVPRGFFIRSGYWGLGCLFRVEYGEYVHRCRLIQPGYRRLGRVLGNDNERNVHVASSFNQDLSNWCVQNIPSLPSWFATSSALLQSYQPAWGTCPSQGSMVGNDNPIASQDAKGDDATNPAEMPQIAVFPNPTTGMVKISPVVEGTYRIYNEVGRTIGAGQIKEAYDFSDQPSGIFMLMLQTENGTQYMKVVKQ